MTLAFAFCPSVVRSLLCVSRTDILESCWCSVIALRSGSRYKSQRTLTECTHRTRIPYVRLRTTARNDTSHVCGSIRSGGYDGSCMGSFDTGMTATTSSDEWYQYTPGGGGCRGSVRSGCGVHLTIVSCDGCRRVVLPP